jgi:hypothetical protein
MSAKQTASGMMRRWAVSTIALAIAATPTLAIAADSCRDLAFQRKELADQAQSLAHDNPGSAAVFAGCFLVAKSDYDQNKNSSHAVATLVACAGTSCGFTDNYKNCISVNTGLFLMAVQDEGFENRMRALPDCPV